MQSYSRRRALSLAVLLAVSLLPVVASAQLGGIGGGFGGTINNTTDVNVANAAQSRHLPRAKHDSHTTLLPYHNKQTISLYAWTRKGLSVRTIDSDGRKWDDWRHLGNNADNPPLYRLDQDDPQNTPAGGGIDTGLVVRDALGASSDHQLFFGYSTSQLTAVSLVSPATGGTQFFVGHPQVQSVQRRMFAEFLSRSPEVRVSAAERAALGGASRPRRSDRGPRGAPARRDPRSPRARTADLRGALRA